VLQADTTIAALVRALGWIGAVAALGWLTLRWYRDRDA
jgi:hypothetical protein